MNNPEFLFAVKADVDGIQLKQLPTFPPMIWCPHCPSSLVSDGTYVRLEHHADGSHTAWPKQATGL